MTPTRETIRIGHVQAEIYPWTHPSGREYWRWDYRDAESGKRRQLTASTPPRLQAKVAAKLREMSGDSAENLSPTMRLRLSRILAVDPTLSLVNEFLDWKATRYPDVTLGQVVTEFLDVKNANRGLSERNIRSLRGDLGSLLEHFPERQNMARITVHDLEKWLSAYSDKSAKRRLNLRASAVTLFRWARRRQYLPDELTAAETLERPKVVRKIPPTYTPEEIRAMLEACPPDYLPWLVFSAFHGLRYSELFPPHGSEKRPLMWEDVDWKRRMITVHPETAKMDERRVIPLQPGAAAWMPPERSTGRVTPTRHPNKAPKRGESVTAALGALVGGWKPNGLRNSFISYRGAQVGLGRTSLEAGNSESEARRSYNDAKSKTEAKEWFAVLKCRTS